MAKFSRNFIAGRMNKLVDQRLLPEGEYIDAMNVRMGDTEKSEVGVIENSKGNLALTKLAYNGTQLSSQAKCIGAIEDSANETIYWFVHDEAFPDGDTGKIDLILSFNVLTNILTYNVISMDDGSGISTTLDFNKTYLITGVNIINDLLFFTDDCNPPRYINTNRNYPNPVGGIDQITAEQLLVIKKPPTQSPTVLPVVTSGQENFMDTRFICFAYRYRYVDGEYSATSQWSQVSFVPNPFSFSSSSMLNEGMVNFCNTAIITYNSGGPLVVGVDLLFKQSANNIIKVIEKLDKANLGLANNTNYDYTFTNSKIFTILPESEILRLYDNVPRFAKAQTIMGNRLMYGNYVEGYNLIDKNGTPIKLEYSTNLITETIGSSTIPVSTTSAGYTIDVPITIPNALVSMDLTGIALTSGSSISLDLTFVHNAFTGSLSAPTEITGSTTINFAFFLTTNYASVYEMASSPEFQQAIGTVSNIKPVYSAVPGTETSCDGTTFTDSMNCIIPNILGTYQKVASGRSAYPQPLYIQTSPGSSSIGIGLIAMKYVDNVTTPTGFLFEYYSITLAEANFQEIATPQSLHSNRGYEIGIVYMDEFNRSTTALVSQNNTVFVPCGYSPNKNSIQVVIPSFQLPPAWAKRYKFVIKPDAENYETIYSNLFFADPQTNDVWFYLEGENTRKIEVGDRLIVKADASGPTPNCAYATVLAKEVQASGFIDLGGVTVPAGVYMKINPNSFSAAVDPESTVALGRQEQCAPSGENYAYLSYPVSIYRGAGYDPANPSWQYEDYTVPAGSRIVFNLDWLRVGVNNSCEQRGYVFHKDFVSTNNYANMKDWFVGDNIEATLTSGTSLDGVTSIQYLPNPSNTQLNTFDFNICYIQFYRDPVTNYLVLQSGTGRSCNGNNYPNSRKYCAIGDITVFRAIDTIVFETLPTDALPDVFFENNLSFAIDGNGNHTGNVQDQDIALGIPAIVDTKFFNCFAFGNGVESYKVRDSLIGRYFTLGERVTSVSAQNYKEADRFADITYSGVYNAESNLNKLNEFNLGLLDYKTLETSFGPIYMMDGRETDVLVLQEDKISYVLAGKNLLSDSAAGGAITSVPEVLGTQIARTEKYGISFNPESYVHWGFNRFFTDVKRGVVLQLIGDSYSNEQLKVISESGMRTWFRDEFNVSFNTQKIGGFDPYMNEYVFSTNDEILPYNPQCLNCGISQTFTLSNLTEEPDEIVYCVDLGPTVGYTDVSWTVSSISEGGSFTISVDYNGDFYTSGPTDIAGVLNFNKNVILVETATITINYSGTMVLNVLADCCNAESLNVVQVVITNDSDVGKTIHTQYRFVDGAFTSPLQSSYVIMSAGGASVPWASLYNITTGFVGTGAFPQGGSTMSLISNQFSTDTFTFSAGNKFKYLRSNTLYANNPAGLSSILSTSTAATPILGGGTYNYAEFTVPSTGSYLYLIWDLRTATPIDLCKSNTVANACCTCINCDSDYNQYRFENETGDDITVFFVDEFGNPDSQFFDSGIKLAYICSIGTPTCSNPIIKFYFYSCNCTL